VDDEDRQLLRHIAETLDRIAENTRPPSKAVEVIEFGAAVAGVLTLVDVVKWIVSLLGG